MPAEDSTKERVQKILARAGFGSRRACEDLIVEGRVTVNAQTVSVLGVRADPQRDVVAVDGERVRLPKPAYWVLNKPEGTSFNDAQSEHALEDLIEGDTGRLFTAGRLDRHSRGLILVTNDGRVANILTHPRYRVPKVYTVTVKGSLLSKNARNIERALYYAMNNGKFEPIKVLKQSSIKSDFQLVVYEGLPQTFRDICFKFGHSVKSIERVRIGPLQVGKSGGSVEKLVGTQVTMLLQYADEAEKGQLQYENELVKPIHFARDESKTGFRRKKTGTQGTRTEGQKKTVARVKREGGSRGNRSERSSSDRPRGSSSDRPRSGSRSGPRGSSSDRPRSGSKSGPRGISSDRPRSGSKSGPRGSSSDRPRSGGKSGPRGSSSSRGSSSGPKRSSRSGPGGSKGPSRGGSGGRGGSLGPVSRGGSSRGSSGPRGGGKGGPRGGRK